MTPDQFCQARAHLAGSSLYYSVVFSTPAQRSAHAAWYAFNGELAEAAAHGADTGVAAAKLAWWTDEIERLVAGRPQHPIAQALKPLLEGGTLDKAILRARIDAAYALTRQNRCLDLAALQAHCQQTGGAVARDYARLNGVSTEPGLACAAALGRFVALVCVLRDVGDDANHGRVHLPIDLLRQHGVTVADVLNRRHVPGFSKVMGVLAHEAREGHRQALTMLPAADLDALRSTVILAAIHRVLLDELEHADFVVMDRRLSLTPLRKLWIAWRTRVFGPRGSAAPEHTTTG